MFAGIFCLFGFQVRKVYFSDLSVQNTIESRAINQTRQFANFCQIELKIPTNKQTNKQAENICVHR
jgi:hypothetical protein